MEPSLWNSKIGRRAFVKKTGAATVGTAIALHGFRTEVMASGSATGMWYIEALPDQGALFGWVAYVDAGPMGAFSYNIHTINVDGVPNAPVGEVYSTLRLRSEVFTWPGTIELDGYAGCTASLDLGGLSGAVLDGIITGGNTGASNQLAGDTGWLHAGNEADPNIGYWAHFYRWVIMEPTVTVTGWGTGFVLRELSFTVTMQIVRVYFLNTQPTTIPAGTIIRTVQNTQISHAQSLRAQLDTE